MKPRGRYVSSEAKFTSFAFEALGSNFSHRREFDEFYNALSNEQVKDEFLRVASFYLFLVKQGDWHVDVDGTEPVVSYLTNSYKLVALFSLIESISGEKYQDFFDWLSVRDKALVFPIVDNTQLRALYDEYKESFGSIRRCVKFFGRLSESRKAELCAAIQVNNECLKTIEQVARFLYNLRSEFVHESRLALALDGCLVVSHETGKAVVTNLSVGALQDAFEEGVVEHFRAGV